jgi:hypothetical protein
LSYAEKQLHVLSAFVAGMERPENGIEKMMLRRTESEKRRGRYQS